MSTIEINAPVVTRSVWPSRLRLAVFVAIGLAYYQVVLGGQVFLRGLDRPFVLWGQIGVGFSLLSLAVLVGCGIGAGVTGRRETALRDGLLTVGWILGLWSALGSTMDQWLAVSQTHAGPATNAPYVALIPDYLTLGAGCGLVVLFLSRRTAAIPSQIKSNQAAVLDGLKALGTVVLIATVVLVFAAGPRFDQTRHGQSAFAAFLAFLVGVAFAKKSTLVESPIWYWPAPIVVGLIAISYAAARPGLPPPYDQINNIPCWGPVRLLPAEMIGVGLLGTLWGLKPGSMPRAKG